MFCWRPSHSPSLDIPHGMRDNRNVAGRAFRFSPLRDLEARLLFAASLRKGDSIIPLPVPVLGPVLR